MKYESLITYHSKDMANVKVFADRQTDKQTDRRTGQKLYAPDLSIRGHKKNLAETVQLPEHTGKPFFRLDAQFKMKRLTLTSMDIWILKMSARFKEMRDLA